MTCREAANLLPLFLDGEIDARQMRSVALHSTRCATCEAELRRLERLQELVSETVNVGVDEVDLSNFWPGIEQRLGTVHVSWWQRARAWWGEGDAEWNLRLPALAAAAAIVVLTLMLLARTPQPTTDPTAPQVAAVDVANPAFIDTLVSDYDVAVINDLDTQTTVLWVSHDTSLAGDVP